MTEKKDVAIKARYFKLDALKYKMIYASNGLPGFFVDLVLLFFPCFFVRRNDDAGFLTENSSSVSARLLICFYVSSS